MKARQKTNKELQKAINLAGSQSKLVEVINTGTKLRNGCNEKTVAQQGISYWLNSGKGVPARWAQKIVRAFPELSLTHLMVGENEE